MGRNTALSVLFLIVMGGTGFALPDWVDAYDFYGAPSSGSLGATADAAIHNVSGTFSTIPKGGFGAPAAAFKDQNGVFPVVQPHPALQFNDRWLFDFAPSTPTSQAAFSAQPRALVVHGGAQLSSVSSRCSATSVVTPSGNAPS